MEYIQSQILMYTHLWYSHILREHDVMSSKAFIKVMTFIKTSKMIFLGKGFI